MKILFRELSKLISFLSLSSISAGYNGIRDHLTPLYSEFFLAGAVEVDDEARMEIQAMAIEQLAMINKVFMYEDRADKILPILLELL